MGPSLDGVSSTPPPTPLLNFSEKSTYQSTPTPSVRNGSVLHSRQRPPGVPVSPREARMPAKVTPVDQPSEKKAANLKSTVSSVTVPDAVRPTVPVSTLLLPPTENGSLVS